MAGINPNLILGIQHAPVQQQDPLANYAKILGVKNAMGQQDLQELQFGEAQRGIADDQATRQAVMESGGDSAKAIERLRAMGLYKPAQAFEKSALETTKTKAAIAKDEAAADKDKLANGIARTERVASALKSVEDAPEPERPAAYAAVRRILAMDPNLGKDAVVNFPEQYDPAFVRTNISTGMTLLQQMEQKHKEVVAAETKRNNLVTSTETNRSHLANEATARGNLGVAQGNLNETRANNQRVDTRAREVASSGRVPSGYRQNPDGSLAFIPGGPADPNAPGNKANPTEDERKAAGWLAQATNAYNNMAKVMKETPGSEGPGPLEALVSTVPVTGDAMARAIRPGARDRFTQASSSFAEAALRAATGAGVNMDEARQKIQELTPLITDGAQARQQKLDSMKVYLDSIQARAGRAVASTPIPRRDTMPDVRGATRGTGPDPTKLSDAELRRELGL